MYIPTEEMYQIMLLLGMCIGALVAFIFSGILRESARINKLRFNYMNTLKDQDLKKYLELREEIRK